MTEKPHPAWIKPALELGPVALFFIAYLWLKDSVFTIGGAEYTGFIMVTAGFVPLIVMSTIALWRITGRLSPMQIMTAVLVVGFGGLSVWLNDPRFFKMKPTMIYLLFSGVLGFGLLRGRSYLALVMEGKIPLTHEGWMILTRRLALFFAALAVLNEAIWRTQPESTWVTFKTFGLTAAIFVFFIAQSGLLKKHSSDED